MTKVANVHEAKTHLSRLLEEVEAGREVILARAGKPVAKLVPYTPISKRTLGFVPGRLTNAFFEPLPEEELNSWG